MKAVLASCIAGMFIVWLVRLTLAMWNNMYTCVLGIGPRKFRTTASDLGDRSVWTDTPADRQRKAQVGIFDSIIMSTVIILVSPCLMVPMAKYKVK